MAEIKRRSEVICKEVLDKEEYKIKNFTNITFIKVINELANLNLPQDRFSRCLNSKTLVDNSNNSIRLGTNLSDYINNIYSNKDVYKFIIDKVENIGIPDNINSNQLDDIIKDLLLRFKQKTEGADITAQIINMIANQLINTLFKYKSFKYEDSYPTINETFVNVIKEKINQVNLNEIEEARRAAAEQLRLDREKQNRDKVNLERIITNEIKQNESLTKSRLQEIIRKIMENINSGDLTLDKDIIANKIVSDIPDKHVKVKLFNNQSDNTNDEKVKTLIKNFIDLYTKFGKDGCESIKEILLKARSSLGGNQELTIPLVNKIITKLDSLSLGLDDAGIKDRIVECLQIVDIGTSKITDKGKNSLPDLITKIIEEYRKAAEAKRVADEEKQKEEDAKSNEDKSGADTGTSSDTTSGPTSDTTSGPSSEITSGPTSSTSSGPTSSTSSSSPTEIPPQAQSTKSYNIKITKVNLTRQITTEIVSETSDNVENASSITKYYTITSDLCNIIKNLYSGIISTQIISSSKISDEEITKLIYRIILSNKFKYTTEPIIFILCYLKMAINKCACDDNNCINLNDKFMIVDNNSNAGTNTVIKALAIRKIYNLFNIYTTTATEDVFKLIIIYYICLNSFDSKKTQFDLNSKSNIYYIFFNSDKFYNPSLLDISLNEPKKLGNIINTITSLIPIGIQKFISKLNPQINIADYLVNNEMTFPFFKRIIELIIENSNSGTESYINSDNFNNDILFWLIFKKCYSIVYDNEEESFKKIFPTSRSEDYITSETVKGIKGNILAYNRYIKTDPACSSINKIIKELNINDYNITEDLLKKIIVKYAVLTGKVLTTDNLWKCLFEHGIYTYNDEDKSTGSQEDIEVFKRIITSLIESSEITGEGEGSIKAEKDKIKAAAEESGRTASEAKRTAEEEKTKAATDEKTKQEADLKTYQNTSLQLWDYLKSQKSEFIKYNETEKTYTVKNQGKINVSFEGSKAVSFDVSLTIKQDGDNYIDTLTLSKNTLAQQGGNKNYSKKKLKRKISKRKNKKRKISKKKKRNNISNKKIYVGGDPTVYNLNDLYLLPPTTLLQGNFTSNTIRLLDSSDDNKTITLNFFAMSNSSAISSPLYKAIKKFYEFKDSSEVLTAIAASKKEKEDGTSCESKEYFIVKTKSRDNWRNSTNILYSYTTIIAKNKIILLYPDVIDKNSDEIYEYTTPEKIMKKFKIDIYDFDDLTLKIEKKDSLQFKLSFFPKTNNPKLIKKFTLDLSTLPNKNKINRCDGNEKCVEFIAYPVVNYLCCKIETTEDSIAPVSSSTSSSSFFSRTGRAISKPFSRTRSAPESSSGRAMGSNSSIVCINVGDYVSEGGNEVISENPGEGDEIPGEGNKIPDEGNEIVGEGSGKNEEIDDDDADYHDVDLVHASTEPDYEGDLSSGGKATSEFKGGKKLNNNKRLTKKKYKGGVCIKQIDPRILSKDLQDKIKEELGIETIGGKTKKNYKRKKNKRKTIRK